MPFKHLVPRGPVNGPSARGEGAKQGLSLLVEESGSYHRRLRAGELAVEEGLHCSLPWEGGPGSPAA